MTHPFIPFSIHIQLSAKGRCIDLFLCPLINDGPVDPVDGSSIGVVFHEVLLDLRTHILKDVTQSAENGKVPADGLFSLEHVNEPHYYQRSCDQKQQKDVDPEV